METSVIEHLETATIFDENATTYNVIVTEHGSFIISNYATTSTDDGTPVHEVTLPNKSEYEKYVQYLPTKRKREKKN